MNRRRLAPYDLRPRVLLSLALAALLLCLAPATAVRAVSGDLDASFGVGGKVTTDLSGSQDLGNAVAIQPDGKIVVAGQTDNTASRNYFDIVVTRYNADGTLDQSFGSGGKVTWNYMGGDDRALAVALAADGKILVAGQAEPNRSSDEADFVLLRFNTDGSLDQSFGSAGVVTTTIYGYDVARAIAVESNGRIVVAGDAVLARFSNASRSDLVAARYNADGTPDQSFGSGGKALINFNPPAESGGSDVANAVAVQPDGRIVLAGAVYNTATRSGDFALVRLNADGTLDQTFGSGGRILTDVSRNAPDQAQALAIQPDGRLVVAGRSYSSGGLSDFAIVRYNAGGTLDAGFGSGGKVLIDFSGGDDLAFAVALEAGGKILAAGTAGMGLTQQDFALVRLNTNGSLDTSFRLGGKVTTDFYRRADVARAIAIHPEGRIVVAGDAQTGNGLQSSDLAVACYEAESVRNDFALVAPPAIQLINVGETKSFTVAVDAAGGLPGPATVRLSATAQPDAPGLGLSLTPAEVSVGGRASLSVSPSSGTPLGLYIITITGANGQVARSTTLAVQVVGPDFALGPSAVITGLRGTTVRVSLSVARMGGFGGRVTVVAPDTSGIGIKVKPKERVVTGDETTAKFKLKVYDDAPFATRELVFTATDELGRVRTATITLLIR